MPDANVFLRAPDAAKMLGVSEWTLQNWRTTGAGPPFVRIGERRIGYRRTDIDAWARARTFTSRADELRHEVG